jgi:mono/diheme cytochrome c family protein
MRFLYDVFSGNDVFAGNDAFSGNGGRGLLWIPLLLAQMVLLPPFVAQGHEPTYESAVRPILRTHCFQCHGELGKLEGNLDLRLRRFVVRGGDSGPAVVPGDEEASLLLDRVSSGEMPPGEDKNLSVEEISILRTWVKAGARTESTEPETIEDNAYFTPQEKAWWAFQPVTQPAVPNVRGSVNGPIDAFLLAKLEENGREANPNAERPNVALNFSPRANRVTLVRRLYLDLLGLPPTPAQIQEFLDDERPAAWERLVDRVLASPRYGERWGRHWLDVAGYADSEGYTDADAVRPHAYRYRDYVIRAFNADKPYSQFLTEQLAGDEIAGWPGQPLTPEITELLAATGFLRMAPDGTASGGIDQNLARNQVVADTLQIVGTSILGMTVQCAQCHDHRYDPIPQRDYYQIRAIFEPAFDWKNWRTPPARQISLYTDAEKELRSEIEGKAKTVDQERQVKVDFYISKTLDHELLMVDEAIQPSLRAAFLAKPPERTDEQKKLLDDHTNVGKISAGALYLYDRRRDVRAKDLDARRGVILAESLERVRKNTLELIDEPARTQVAAAAQTVADERNAEQVELLKAHPGMLVAAETLHQFDEDAASKIARYEMAAMEIRQYRIKTELQEFADRAVAVRATIPAEGFLRIASETPDKIPVTFRFHRGDHDQPKEQVQPRGLSIIHSPEIASAQALKTTGRRLAFAQQLTSGDHPLVARAMVNRLWGWHFGKGIVTTSGDFGRLGARPSHPELLDWLATELVRRDWSVKQLQRLILLSNAYQQSSIASPTIVDSDPENRLLGRWPLRRLESETLRDAILFATGKMNSQMFGTPVPVMEDEVGQIVLGIENLDGERKPTKAIPLDGAEFRRSLYVQVRRTRPYGVLESFDLADHAPNCTDRATSTVATQSLMLMNSDFVIQMSEAMADRLIQERPDDTTAQLALGWSLAFGTAASAADLQKSTDFLRQQSAVFAKLPPPSPTSADTANNSDISHAHRLALATFCQALLGSNAFLYID